MYSLFFWYMGKNQYNSTIKIPALHLILSSCNPPTTMSVSRKKSKIRTIGIQISLGILVLLWGSISVLGADTVYNQIREMIGTGGLPHSLGSFFSSNGNPWEIDFWADPIDGYSGAHLFVPGTGSQTLSGSFWIDTIGWVALQDVALELDTSNTGSNIWSLSGYAWSDYAGWVDFSGTTYQLSNTSFSWYAWNDGIGWIDMAGASLDMTSSGAIGKVKVLGNLWGNRIYNTIYDLNGKISPATTNKIVNEVRKNVALVTRNLGNKINTALISNNVFDNADTKSVGNKLVFENTWAIVARVNYDSSIKSRMENASTLDEPIYSVIAIGADIYIDYSVVPQDDWHPRVMIALKNSAWVGGNIYIDGGITRIKSSLVAERSIYSGEYSVWGVKTVYNDDAGNLFKIPNRQLYIYGTIISNNTIGGYSIDNGTANYCPYDITPCDNDTALTFDYNHFRDFQQDLPEWQKAVLRGYQPPWFGAPSDKYDAYSMIIEHDPRIISDPPPGLERMK